MNNVELRESVTMGYSTEAKRSSLHQAFHLEKEKVLSPKASRSSKLRDKGKTLKSENPLEQPCTDDHKSAVKKYGDRHSFPPSTSGSCQKQSPSEVNTEAEELVKHMSKVPGYLQRVQRGHNVEKALNFGVLDWGRLEKWTYNQGSVVNGGNLYSPSCSDASSFSLSGSSSQSFPSSGSSSISQKNQSPYFNCRRNLSTKDDATQVLRDKSYRHDADYDNLENATRNVSNRLEQVLKTHHKLEGSKGTDSYSKTVTSNSYQTSSFSPLPSTSKEYYTSAPVRERKNARNGSSIFQAEKVQVSDNFQQSCSGKSIFHRNWQQEQSSRFLQHIDSKEGHLHERSHGSVRFSSESQESDNARQTELNTRSLSGLFFSEKVQCASRSPIGQSYSFSSNIGTNGWSDVQALVSESGQDTVTQSDAISNPLYSSEIAKMRFIDNLEKQNMFTASDPSQITAKKDDVKTSDRTGRKSMSHDNLGIALKRMTRNSSLKESSASKVISTAQPNSSTVDKATGSSRARQSPLRRMLDPLLKSKASKQIHFPETIAASSHPHVCDTEKPNVVRDSQHVSTSTFTGHAGSRSSSPSPAPTRAHRSLQDEKQDASSKQALLQLVWKSGLPLFTFSINDSEILVATKKRSFSSKEALEGTYTFYSIQETKKKGGGWISHDSKSKRKGLASTVIGQMNVSCSQCPSMASPDLEGQFTSREFVLFGAELRSEAHETSDCLSSKEMAAIIVRVPKEKSRSLGPNKLQFVINRDLSQTEVDRFHGEKSETASNMERSNSGVVAILPSEAHGLSETGRPSTLIERWKTGGSCDCGGWDVGCSLRILTDKLEESKSSRGIQSRRTTDGTHRAELYIEGGVQENKRVFSLVAFKEGLYTVEFHASFGALQVFAVCVAILHSRSSTSEPLEEQDSAQCMGDRMKGHARRNSEAPAGYVQCHPPLSPVRRA